MNQAMKFENPGQAEASEQLALIESMIREGRRSTEYWGWCFLLWGVAYIVATAWSSVLTDSRSALWAWPVTITVSGASTYWVARWRNKGLPVTTTSRAIVGVWMAVGFGITIFAFPATIAHRFGDGHLFLAAIEVLLGVAHIASGSLLRWPIQVAVGLCWWTAALIAMFTHGGNGVAISFLAATFLCNIVFGGYLMYREGRDKAMTRGGRVVHA